MVKSLLAFLPALSPDFLVAVFVPGVSAWSSSNLKGFGFSACATKELQEEARWKKHALGSSYKPLGGVREALLVYFKHRMNLRP